MIAPFVLGAPDGTWFVLSSILPAGGMAAALPLALLASARLQRHLGPILERGRGLPLRSFLVGMLAALAVLLLAAATNTSRLFLIPALLGLATAAILGFLGLVAEARRLGCELRGRDPSGDSVEAGSTAVGWLVLAGLPLLAVVGPLVLLFLALRGTGAAAVAVAARD